MTLTVNNNLSAVVGPYNRIKDLQERSVALEVARVNDGNKAQRTEELGKNANEFYGITAQIAQLKAQQPVVQGVISKMNAAHTAVRQIWNVLEVFNESLLRYNSFDNQQDPNEKAAASRDTLALVNGTKQAIMDALNMMHDGKYVFGSGINDEDAPVGDIVNNSNIGADDAPTTNYVNLPAAKQTVKIAGITVDSTLNPGDDGFKNVIAALNLIEVELTADPLGLTPQNIALFEQGLAQVGGYEARIANTYHAAKAAEVKLLSDVATLQVQFSGKFEYQEGELDAIAAENRDAIQGLMIATATILNKPTLAQILSGRA